MAFTTLFVLSAFLFCVAALAPVRFNGLLTYRGTGRLERATVLAYRGSGRFSGLLAFYRGSERDLQAA